MSQVGGAGDWKVADRVPGQRLNNVPRLVRAYTCHPAWHRFAAAQTKVKSILTSQLGEPLTGPIDRKLPPRLPPRSFDETRRLRARRMAEPSTGAATGDPPPAPKIVDTRTAVRPPEPPQPQGQAAQAAQVETPRRGGMATMAKSIYLMVKVMKEQRQQDQDKIAQLGELVTRLVERTQRERETFEQKQREYISQIESLKIEVKILTGKVEKVETTGEDSDDTNRIVVVRRRSTDTTKQPAE